MPGAVLAHPELAPAAADRAALALPASLTLALALIVGFSPLPRDPDLWFHLASGGHILTTGAVPQTDPFSLTRAGAAWMPHSWLFDVAVRLGWDFLGPRATEALFACVFAAAILLVFGLLTARGVAPLAAVAGSAALAVAAGNARGLRPQTLSLLFCAVVVTLLVRHAQAPHRRTAWLLPLVFLLWAQVHAACVVGVLLVALWLGGRVLDALADRAWDQRRRELGHLAVGLCLALLAVLITPHRMTHFAYARFTAGLGALTHTQEWQPPRPLAWEIPDVYAYGLVLAVVTVLARARRRAGWAEIAVAGALLVLALAAVRHIPLACVGVAPLLAAAHARPAHAPASGLRRHGAGLVLVAVGVLAVTWGKHDGNAARYAAVEPVAGARALALLDGEWRVFTTYNTGSYVLNAAPGRLRVFIDSRADVFGDELFAEMRRAQLGHDWQELFRRWDINAAVIERGDPLADLLCDDPAWRLLAKDPATLTFIRKDALPQLCGLPALGENRSSNANVTL